MNVVSGLLTRIAQKILPIGKELASKAIGVLGDKIGSAAKDVLGVAREKLMSLVTKNRPVKLPSTNKMPPDMGKEIKTATRSNCRLRS